MSILNPRDEVCVQTDWAFVGYLKDGTRVPIGVYKLYCDGAAHANAWTRSTPTAERWEGEQLYEPLTSESGAEA